MPDKRWMIVLFVVMMLFSVMPASQVFADDDDVIVQVPFEGQPSAKQIVEFRKELLAVVQTQLKAGEITRIQALKYRIASRDDEFVIKAYKCCAEQAQADGLIQGYGAIDWTALKDLIIELLPLLLSFFFKS